MPQMNLDRTVRESNNSYGDALENDLKLLLEKKLRSKYNGIIIDQDRDMNINRSGSAPPTIEGSLTAAESIFSNPNFTIDNYQNSNYTSNNTTAPTTNSQSILSEEEIRSHPAYLLYYYSPENLNPRLPPPLLSREHWRMAQRFNQGSGDTWPSWVPTGEDTMVNALDNVNGGSSLFSVQPMLSPSVADMLDDRHEMMGFNDFNNTDNLLRAYPSTDSLDKGPDGSIWLSGGDEGLGMRRRKSFADILQEGLERPTSKPSRLSRPSSHSCLSNMVDETGTIHKQHPEDSHNDNMGLPRVQSFGSLHNSESIRSARATTASMCATPTPRIPTAMKRVTSVDNIENIARMNTLNRALSSSMNNLADIAASISLLSQSINQVKHDDCQELHQHKVRFEDDSNMLLNLLSVSNGYCNLKAKSEMMAEQNGSLLGFDSTTGKSSPSYRSKAPPGFTNLKGSNISCQSSPLSVFTSPMEQPRGSSIDKTPEFSNYLDKGGFEGLQRISSPNRGPKTPPGFPILRGSNIPSPVEKPIGYSSDKRLELSNHLNEGGSTLTDNRNGQIKNMQKLSDPRFINSMTSPRNNTKASNEMLLQQALKASQAEALQYSPLLQKSTAQFNQPYYPNQDSSLNIMYKGNPEMANGRKSCFNTAPLRANVDVLPSPLLEELKSNQPRPLELIDIVDNVFDFSKDQYGSRFIQQKLETSTVEQKSQIFPEILFHCRALTADVFGNYVIQKFFEHGTENQRRDLAKQLVGHVLPFSLQMYGCRVIQKALEVIDMEQRTMLVSELDGSIMKCVCDQNGNHVIQKCIQCVPQEKIHFIIKSFFGQIAALSTHPYGCRVIQRVLEHCDDPNAQKIIVDEIVQSSCTLAQDQYGNYVVQHVIQHGKPHEQTAIIKKLAGQIVKMSKQKFASNVVEKCLIFGGPEDRQLIVKEMLGTTDENEPLQAMTKDPFGNYVVQKVLETCDSQSCELIVSRLKLHLSTLKRYTYGKHIVSRVEKLIAAGEGRGGAVSSKQNKL